MAPVVSSNSRSRDLVIVVAYLFATVVVGAAIAPLLFKLGRGVAEMIGSENGAFGWLYKVAAESEFKRYFNRAVLLAAVIGLWPLVRLLKMKRSDFGLRPDRFWCRHLTLGFLVAAGFLLQMGLAYATADLFGPQRKLDLADSLQKAILTAAGVSILEELLFRGALTGLLLRSLNQWGTLLSVAILFAVLHFLKPPDSFEIADENVGMGSGFHLVYVVFAQFSNFDHVMSEFGTLLMVGLLLGYARMRTGALWLPIGLHAGWVFGVFAYRGVFAAGREVKSGEYLPLLGESLKTGVIPLAVLAITGGLLVWWMRRTYPENRAD